GERLPRRARRDRAGQGGGPRPRARGVPRRARGGDRAGGRAPRHAAQGGARGGGAPAALGRPGPRRDGTSGLATSRSLGPKGVARLVTQSRRVSGERSETASAERSAALGGARGGLLISRQTRSEEHTSELQSRLDLGCRFLLEKKQKSCRNY